MHGVLGQTAKEDAILEGQDAALACFGAQDFGGMVLRYTRQALDARRLTRPAVAPDFWRQFALADELEAIRSRRPAAFRALPLAPEDEGPVAELGHRR